MSRENFFYKQRHYLTLLALFVQLHRNLAFQWQRHTKPL
jgi:hypothetical protein